MAAGTRTSAAVADLTDNRTRACAIPVGTLGIAALAVVRGTTRAAGCVAVAIGFGGTVALHLRVRRLLHVCAAVVTHVIFELAVVIRR